MESQGLGFLKSYFAIYVQQKSLQNLLNAYSHTATVATKVQSSLLASK